MAFVESHSGDCRQYCEAACRLVHGLSPHYFHFDAQKTGELLLPLARKVTSTVNEKATYHAAP